MKCVKCSEEVDKLNHWVLVWFGDVEEGSSVMCLSCAATPKQVI